MIPAQPPPPQAQPLHPTPPAHGLRAGIGTCRAARSPSTPATSSSAIDPARPTTPTTSVAAVPAAAGRAPAPPDTTGDDGCTGGDRRGHPVGQREASSLAMAAGECTPSRFLRVSDAGETALGHHRRRQRRARRAARRAGSSTPGAQRTPVHRRRRRRPVALPGRAMRSPGRHAADGRRSAPDNAGGVGAHAPAGRLRRHGSDPASSPAALTDGPTRTPGPSGWRGDPSCSAGGIFCAR